MQSTAMFALAGVLGTIAIGAAFLARRVSAEEREAIDSYRSTIGLESRRVGTTERRTRDEQIRDLPDPAALRREIAALPDTLTAALHASIEGAEGFVPVRIERQGRHLLVRNQRTRADVLFVRNPVHPWELEAAVVDHLHRAVIGYTHSDLVNESMPSSWIELARFGLTAAESTVLGPPTGATKTAFGVEFRQRRCELDPGEDGLVELWWNDEHQVPLLLRRRVGGRVERQELRALRFAVDDDRIPHPAEHFASYARQDLSDYRERHVGCGRRIVRSALGR